METETTEVHTQSPWRVEPFEKRDGRGFAIITDDKDEIVVAWLYQYAPNSFGRMMRSGQDHKANAKLLAAAPDLLAACKYAFKMLDDLDINTGDKGDQAYQALESAIKKATS